MSFKTLSFIDLFKTENFIVEIPMLQRDYAYGRESEKEKRNEFLEKIKEYLNSEELNHQLDFIYGTTEKFNDETKLILLDGQQRITTLFLLHWYLAIINQRYDDFRNLLLKNGKSKFTYNIRKSSEDFCSALVKLQKSIKNSENKEDAKLENEENDYFEYLKNKQKLSSKIRDEKWFFNHWNNDPTVINMLNMLDDIAEKFSKEECNGFYDKLNQSGEKSYITFNFLPLDEYKLTDELYIKMNSRGKLLTRFENLKSKMLKLYDDVKETRKYKSMLEKINKKENKNYVSLRDYVGLMIDTRWQDMFWNFGLEIKNETNPSVDDMFLSFISNLCVCYNALNLINSTESKFSMQRNSAEEKEINSLLESKNNISYEKIVGILKEDDNKLLFDLIDILNLLCEEKEEKKWKLKTYFDESLYFFNETEMFKTIVYDYSTNDRNYEPRAIYFGYIKYLINYKPEKNDNFFADWMRFVYDVCKNSYTLANAVSTFSNALKGIDYLCDKDIYNSLANLSENKKSIDNVVTLDKYQLKEEVLKSKLFTNTKWKKSINSALSDLRYFEGQLSFELNVCNISENDINNNSKIDEFSKTVKKLSSIFDEKENGCSFDAELVKALLSKGDYLTLYRSSYSLYRNGNSRDISWLRFHKAEEQKEKIDKQKCLAEVIEDVDFDFSKPKDSLKKISSKRSENLPEWRKVLIDNLEKFEENPDGFKLGEDRLLRWNWANTNHKNDDGNYDNWEIDLISKSYITSRHVELFSYALYLNHKDEEVKPFGKPKYNYSTTENDEPFMKYGEVKYKNETYFLEVHHADDKKFLLRFINWNNEEQNAEKINNSEIQTILKENKFDEHNNIFSKLVDKDKIMDAILNFAITLN